MGYDEFGWYGQGLPLVDEYLRRDWDEYNRPIYHKGDDKLDFALDGIDYFAEQPVMCAGFLFMIVLLFVMI